MGISVGSGAVVVAPDGREYVCGGDSWHDWKSCPSRRVVRAERD